MVNFPQGGDKYLNIIYQIIEDNLENEDFSVEELSEKAGLIRSMLHRKLKKLTGKSASELITEKRLTKAKVMLENNEGTAAEIAYKVGFGSPSYFSKVFKKYYQVSPGELKKGKNIIHNDHFKKSLPGKKEVKTLFIILPIVLITAVLICAGIRFYNGKTDRSEISIAILPFDNLSTIENTQYFADGVVEDLLNRLATIKEIKVISRTSSEIFRKKREKTVPEIGELLGASHIVEGSVQRVGDKIRISIQLIDAKTDNHILSKQYDRGLNDFFEVQSEIAGEIVSELSLTLTNIELENIRQNQTHSLQAFEYYRLGRFYSSKRKRLEFYKGIEYYEKAVEIDPDYAEAYAALADNYYLLSIYGVINREEGRNKTLNLINKALNINPDLAEAHTVLGSIYTQWDWNWAKAEEELKKAINVNPNYSTAHQYYGEFLNILGRFDEARIHFNKGMQLDPYSIIIRFMSGRLHYDLEEFDEALADIKICLDIDKNYYRAYDLKFDIYLALNNDTGALDVLKQNADRINLWTPEQVDSVYQIGGIDEVKRWITSLNIVEPKYHKAIMYAMMGDYENALDLLELKFEAGDMEPWEPVFLEYKPLRSNPRFIAIREKMGLPPLEP